MRFFNLVLSLLSCCASSRTGQDAKSNRKSRAEPGEKPASEEKEEAVADENERQEDEDSSGVIEDRQQQKNSESLEDTVVVEQGLPEPIQTENIESLESTVLEPSLPEPLQREKTKSKTSKARKINRKATRESEIFSDIIFRKGFPNLEFKCCLNAILQCFIKTVGLEFYNHVKKMNISGIFTESLAQIIHVLTQNNLQRVLKDALKRFHSNVVKEAGADHEDAVELLRCFLRRLQQEEVERDCQLLEKWFHGSLKRSRKCVSCGKSVEDSEETISPFLLSLPVEQTLDKCIDGLFKPIRVDMEENWRCEHCGRPGQTLDCTEPEQLPEILILHLKRFEDKKSKNTRKIHIPEVQTMNNLSYKLVAIVNQCEDNSDMWYYTAVVKSLTQFYLFHDDHCQKTCLQATGEEYILFYRKLPNL